MYVFLLQKVILVLLTMEDAQVFVYSAHLQQMAMFVLILLKQAVEEWAVEWGKLIACVSEIEYLLFTLQNLYSVQTRVVYAKLFFDIVDYVSVWA